MSNNASPGRTNTASEPIRPAEDEFQISPRIRLRPGDCFRCTGGPEYAGRDGVMHRMRLRGTYLLCRVVRRRRRTYLDAYEVNAIGQRGATRLIFVEGRPYRTQGGLLQRPFKIKKLKGGNRQSYE